MEKTNIKILGVDIGGTEIKAGLVEDCKIIDFVEVPTHANKSQKEIFSQICKAIDLVISKETRAIGIGVPAICDTKKGIVYDCVNIPSWKNYALKKEIETKYKLPVRINNDANCFALAELMCGKGIKFDNIVGITIGTGLGAGIIINGVLYEGKNCGAGEIGRLVIEGNKLETFCSSKYFNNNSANAETNHNAKQLYDIACNSKNSSVAKKAKQTYTDFGKDLGEAVSNVINAYSPEVVIIGGSIANAKKFFEKSMLSEIKLNIPKQSAKEIKVVFSSLNHAGVIGAALLF